MQSTEITEYKGKEVIVYTNRESYNCFVAQCDRTKGITIKSLETEENVFCLNREEAMKCCKAVDVNRQYHLLFSKIVAQIEKGYGDFVGCITKTEIQADNPRTLVRRAVCAWS